MDADAAAYIEAVETADGAAMPQYKKDAITLYVMGCKLDSSLISGVSNWEATKASCLWAGPKTLAGATVPLRGPAPTLFNFVAGDYSQTTGLLGDGTAKYADINWFEDSVGLNNIHGSVFITSPANTLGPNAGIFGSITGGNSLILFPTGTGAYGARCRSSTVASFANGRPLGFVGISRSASDQFITRAGQQNYTHAIDSAGTTPGSMRLFRRGDGNCNTVGIAAYSFGESVDLVALDLRQRLYMQRITGPHGRGFPLSRLVN